MYQVLKSKIPRYILDNVPRDVPKGVAEPKQKDVLSLLPYVRADNRAFYKDHLKSFDVNAADVADDESDGFGILALP